MKLTSQSFTDGDQIPPQFAFAVPDSASHVALSDNRNPHLAWENVPAGTQSFVLICHDPDAPADPTDANVEGRTVAATAARANFFHWTLLDIPADTREIAEAAHSNGVTARGKSGPAASAGLRHGLNNYTNWFAGDPDMVGKYFGYDGPCPPWNDALQHRYVFTLYALATPTLQVTGDIDGESVLQALTTARVLGSASLTGWYTLNPEVAAALAATPR